MIEIITPLAEQYEDIAFPNRRASRLFAEYTMKKFADSFRYNPRTETMNVTEYRETATRHLVLDMMGMRVMHPSKPNVIFETE